MRRLDPKTLRRHGGRESGQATTEFALILFPLLLLVAGIIQFGIGLNFWLDEQRVANQGARWAVVNAWPGCDRAAAADSCIATPACAASMPNTTLANYLKCQAISQGLRDSVVVSVCYPDDGVLGNDGTVGSPVRVGMDSPFKFVPILGVGTITLSARATMRLEQTTDPARAVTGEGAPVWGYRMLSRQGVRGSAKERGQVVVVFALLIPVIFALAAIVLDIGNWYVHKRHLQTQVDAAAFAGAHEFFGCSPLFEDPPVTANKSIKAHALEYAGDTQRPPSSVDPMFTTTTVRNTQVQEPDDVRAVINSATWWAQGDVTDGSTLDNTLDPDGDPATPGDPCTTKTLDVKATDDEAPSLWGLIPLTPSPKTKARVEIRQIIEESGMLPFAVPEVDPARVAALFVNEITGVKYDFQ